MAASNNLRDRVPIHVAARRDIPAVYMTSTRMKSCRGSGPDFFIQTELNDSAARFVGAR
jgi:hypothetical protein